MSLFDQSGARVLQVASGNATTPYAKIGAEVVRLVDEDGNDLAARNIEGHGSPVGAVTPSAKNQFYVDVDQPGLWQSTGLTSADWRQWV